MLLEACVTLSGAPAACQAAGVSAYYEMCSFKSNTLAPIPLPATITSR